MRKVSLKIIILFLSGIMILSCDRNRSMRGYDFIPDMVYSQAYDTYSENPNFEDSMTMRVPVTGTVPIGFIPFRYTIDSISRAKAGDELINPYMPTDEVIASGKLLYTTFCIGCHGPLGKGDGQLFISGLYPLKPREISAEPTANLRDGEIYHTITLGFGSMGAHGAQIKPADRWKIVHYVRELQREARMVRDSIQ
ncbi:MAG TPA: cytochrome c [Bacteroidales bacterium]|nr:cytochrome c [Bacteroidales bacterium]